MKSSNKPWTRVGAIQFVADTARERVRKATQLADAIGGHSIEKQWTALYPVVFEVHKIDGSVDTVEYRNIEGSSDDLKTINYREDGESTWSFTFFFVFSGVIEIELWNLALALNLGMFLAPLWSISEL
ncbi:hypothetical protein POTOM_041083 [Populus tomentosa]|uniref:Uncharacterized protein n=1 Tax=Populus tomentosa TaxID=118781 RepID=A0A8X7YSC4_POPTO|nr:hypothetical protein POTOM_041083 [Populus tomentosa]